MARHEVSEYVEVGLIGLDRQRGAPPDVEQEREKGRKLGLCKHHETFYCKNVIRKRDELVIGKKIKRLKLLLQALSICSFHLLRIVKQLAYNGCRVRASPPEDSAPHDIMQHGLDLLVAMELLDVDSLCHLVTTDDGLLGVSLT